MADRARLTIQIPSPSTSRSSDSTLRCMTDPLSSSSSLPSPGSATTFNKKASMQTAPAPMPTFTPDILALGDLLASMRRTLNTLSTTSDILSTQIEKMAVLCPATKASEEVRELTTVWTNQVEIQAKEMDSVKEELVRRLKDGVEENIRQRLLSKVEVAVAARVQSKVRSQLEIQVPEGLRYQGHMHKRQILEIRTNLHNSDARRFNSNLQCGSLQPLRPLLRPLPTPLQSPAPYLYSTPASAVTPGSTFPLNAIPEDDEQPLTPSPLFPKTIKAVLSLSNGDVKVLAHDYGIMDNTDDEGMREETLTKFMAHIGVRAQDDVADNCRPTLRVVIPGPGRPAITFSDYY